MLSLDHLLYFRESGCLHADEEGVPRKRFKRGSLGNNNSGRTQSTLCTLARVKTRVHLYNINASPSSSLRTFSHTCLLVHLWQARGGGGGEKRRWSPLWLPPKSTREIRQCAFSYIVVYLGRPRCFLCRIPCLGTILYTGELRRWHHRKKAPEPSNERGSEASSMHN